VGGGAKAVEEPTPSGRLTAGRRKNCPLKLNLAKTQGRMITEKLQKSENWSTQIANMRKRCGDARGRHLGFARFLLGLQDPNPEPFAAENNTRKK
jgi:hypothetical protein